MRTRRVPSRFAVATTLPTVVVMLATVALLTLPLGTVTGQGAGTTTRLSVHLPGVPGHGASFSPAISSDARFVAFASFGSNLVLNDTNGGADYFVLDRQTGQISLISVASSGAQGNGDSTLTVERPRISADGRLVAFASAATNLVPNDTNDLTDVFVHDRQTGRTSRVSVRSNGSQVTSIHRAPAISADGRYAAFDSRGEFDVDTNGDGVCDHECEGLSDGKSDVFVHDRQTGQISVASLDTCQTGETCVREANYLNPSLSVDGRYVAFQSDADLVSGDTNINHIFVRDRQTNRTSRVSVSSSGASGNGRSRNPAISAAGRYVAFVSSASNLVAGDTNASSDIFVHDRQTGTTTRVSASSSGAQGDGGSFVPFISADGRYVAFESDATNLVSGDTNGTTDAFLHDRQTGTTTRVSVSSSGAEGNAQSGAAQVSASGLLVVFDSLASNLAADDPNLARDIFLRELGTTGGTTPVPPTITPTPTFTPTPTATPTPTPTVVTLRNRTSGCSLCPPSAGEPVNTATGEFFIEPEVDVNLGGPLPLIFVRYYASRLTSETTVGSSLGPSWMHTFDYKVRVQEAGTVARIVYARGNLLQFHKRAGAWTLLSNADDTEEMVYQLQEDGVGELWLMDPARDLVFHFRAAGVGGQLSEIKDRNGNTLTLSYDGAGRLTQAADGLGRQLTLSYDAGGNLTQVRDGVRRLTYSYTAGVLTGFTDALGNRTNYVYDPIRGDGNVPLVAVQRPLGNRRYTQTYDTQGRVTRQTDALGNALTLRYDTPSAGVTTITDALGRSRTNAQANERVLTEATDAQGKTTKITRDANDRPTQVTDRLGNTTAVTYDAETGRPSAVTDARGNAGRVTYASQQQLFGPVTFTFRRVTRIDYPDGTSESFSHDVRGNTLEWANRAGSTWKYTYNSRGQALTETNPDGGVSTFTYNGDGTVASSRDTDAGTKQYGYDLLRRQTEVANSDGSRRHHTFDLNDRVIASTSENGRPMSFSYDANGNLTARTDPAGGTIRYAYDGLDRSITITNRLGGVSVTTYDALGHVASWRDPNGNTLEFKYDERGRQVEMVDGEGKVRRTEYDAEGRETGALSPLGRSTHYERDRVGNVVRITNPLGRSVGIALDSMSRPVAVSDPLGRVTQVQYDILGQVTGYTFPGIGASSYGYNASGQLTTIRDLRGKLWSVDYTPMGRLSAQRDPLGNQTQFSYDQRGRRSQITYPTGETQAVTRDAEDNIVLVRYSDGRELQFTYDAFNRTTGADGIAVQHDREGQVIDTQDGAVRFGAAYDAGGRLTGVSYNNEAFTVTYGYDKRNLLTQVQDNLTGTTVTFSYDDDGRLVRLARPNGVATTYAWDAASRPIRIQDGNVADQQYAYDAVGHITQVIQAVPLDPAGLVLPRADAFSYDDASQLSTPGYTVDARGRQTATPGRTLAWNAANELVAVGPTVLEYNGLGDLRRRTEQGTALHFYYNAALGFRPIVAERDANSRQFLRYYVWTPDGQLLYMIDGSAGNRSTFFHFDHAGSTLFLTNASGSVTDSYAYTPYGMLLAHSGASAQPFMFVGKYGVRREGSSGLYHMRSRYYDAVTGRFLSRDPAGPRIDAWDSLNPYLYAKSDPVNYLDPQGRQLDSAVRYQTAQLVKKQFSGEAMKKILAAMGRSKSQDPVPQDDGSKDPLQVQLAQLEDELMKPVYAQAGKELDPYLKDIWQTIEDELKDPINYVPVKKLGEVAFVIKEGLASEGIVDDMRKVATIVNITMGSVSLKDKIAELTKFKEQWWNELAPYEQKDIKRGSYNVYGNKSDPPPWWKVINEALRRMEELQRLDVPIGMIICEAENQGITSVDNLLKFAADEWNFGDKELKLLRIRWLQKQR